MGNDTRILTILSCGISFLDNRMTKLTGGYKVWTLRFVHSFGLTA